MTQLVEEVQIEDNVNEEDEIIPYQYDITSYGVDFPVDSLVKRIRNGDIFIPSFQRSFVWSHSQASKFVESFLLGLPVPGIFLSRETKTRKLLVIDGQQRLRTLQYFYDGIFKPNKREFSLRGIPSNFEGETYQSLSAENKRRLNDSILHATIVQQDNPTEDNSSIYHIFERLNTGGTKLSPQEIRACIYHGEFDNYLKAINNYISWRSLFGKVNKRMRDQELILRFYSLYFEYEKYIKSMKDFLNKFMARNRHLQKYSKELLDETFIKTVNIIFKAFGNDAFKPRRSFVSSIFDSVMVGVAYRLQDGEIRDLNTLKKQYQELLSNSRYIESTIAQTSDEKNVKMRIKLAIKAFADVS